ncbi:MULTISPECIES: nitrate reductase [Cobetia]|uniref:nitrate reductase n=1 Tax=Cobetia TaxID=204286 RepID=UPI000866377B|nr:MULTISPECIES: nitrate reductase [Cobetia]AOM00361.1 nitrate reductase [Cobetia marina]
MQVRNPPDAPQPARCRATTTCPYCGVGCGVAVELEQDQDSVRIVSLSGDVAHPANHGRLCVKGSALAETLSADGRLTMPQVRDEAGVLREVSWETALDLIAARFADLSRTHGGESIAAYLSGQLLTEDYYVANKLFKGFIGTPHLDTNSRLCMASAVVAHKRAFGADAVPCSYEDLERAELVVLVGSNLAWNHPVLFQRLKQARIDNPLLRIVVIDPRVTDSCEIADLYLGLRPGSDARLFNGLLAYMADRGRLDRLYLKAHTQGFDAALKAARREDCSLAAIARDCDVDVERLETFYYWFATQLHVVTLFSQGVNQSTSGTDKGNAIINCHLAGGKLGLPGAGPFSITGQPNAMGGREVGGLANQLAAHMDYETPGARELVGEFWNAPNIPQGPGHKAVELFAAIERGEIQALWIMATNPAVSLPDSTRVRAALAACPLVIVSECMADSDTLAYADVVLPASSWSEKDGTVTNSERCISRQRGLLAPPGEARHDWWQLAEVGKRMGYQAAFGYSGPHAIFREHARLSGFRNVAPRHKAGSKPLAASSIRRLFNIAPLAELDREGYDALRPIQWPVRRGEKGELIGTLRLFEDATFNTPNGRARLVPVTPQLPHQALSDATPLRLNTGRIRDQWHTMTRTARSARLMNHRAEPFVELHPQDAAARGLQDGALAQLAGRDEQGSVRGDYRARVRISHGQRQGEVFIPMHWNDHFASHGRAGALLAGLVDPLSGQPESKHGAVDVMPLPCEWQATLLIAPGVWGGHEDLAGAMTELEGCYWARIPQATLVRCQLAGEGQPDWALWCERHLSVQAGLWAQDVAQGGISAAGFREGRLIWWLRVTAGAARSDRQPNIAWLGECFASDQLSALERRSLLAGRLSGQADVGTMVCACHQVGELTIRQAIQSGDRCVEALGARLACGTRCGSCLPELKRLVEEERSDERTDSLEMA